MNGQEHNPEHFRWSVNNGVATVTLDRPEKKNPLTFESYDELRNTFHRLDEFDDVDAVVITGSGGNFCSGGDVHEIIGPLVERDMDGLLEFTRMTGDLVRAIRNCPQVVVAAIEGVCVGAGAAVAMASDMRFGTPDSSVAFLFVRVGLSGCDMGACSILPRLIGRGRAAELLFTGRSMSGEEAHEWGFYNRLVDPEDLQEEATSVAESIADGPVFAHEMTKRMLNQEWNMSVDQALEMEAQSQAICMQTNDFKRAYEAFIQEEQPDFQGD